MERDVRLDEEDYPSEPPPRNLAAYLPDSWGQDETGVAQPEYAGFSTATAKCPICGVFEGDEVAVSRHVEEHLT